MGRHYNYKAQGRRYGTFICNICGKKVSLCGMGAYQHDMKHKREASEAIHRDNLKRKKDK